MTLLQLPVAIRARSSEGFQGTDIIHFMHQKAVFMRDVMHIFEMHPAEPVWRRWGSFTEKVWPRFQKTTPSVHQTMQTLYTGAQKWYLFSNPYVFYIVRTVLISAMS